MTVAYREGEMVRTGRAARRDRSAPLSGAAATGGGAAAQGSGGPSERADRPGRATESLIAKNAIAQQILQTQRATVAQDEATLKTDQAAIDSAKLNLDYCHITAPISDASVFVSSIRQHGIGAPRTARCSSSRRRSRISVDLHDSRNSSVAEVGAALKAGRPLRVDAIDRDGTDILASGELTTLDNQIDQTTGTLKLRADRAKPRRCAVSEPVRERTNAGSGASEA